MTIEDIKQQLREIIELSNKATPAPWVFQGGDLFGSICSESKVVCGCPVRGERRNNASLIATSRNLTPKMAKVLLGVIENLEERSKKQGFLPGSLNICPTAEAHTAFSQLENIRREWGVQK